MFGPYCHSLPAALAALHLFQNHAGCSSNAGRCAGAVGGGESSHAQAEPGSFTAAPGAGLGYTDIHVSPSDPIWIESLRKAKELSDRLTALWDRVIESGPGHLSSAETAELARWRNAGEAVFKSIGPRSFPETLYLLSIQGEGSKVLEIGGRAYGYEHVIPERYLNCDLVAEEGFGVRQLRGDVLDGAVQAAIVDRLDGKPKVILFQHVLQHGYHVFAFDRKLYVEAALKLLSPSGTIIIVNDFPGDEAVRCFKLSEPALSVRRYLFPERAIGKNTMRTEGYLLSQRD